MRVTAVAARTKESNEGKMRWEVRTSDLETSIRRILYTLGVWGSYWGLVSKNVSAFQLDHVSKG